MVAVAKYSRKTDGLCLMLRTTHGTEWITDWMPSYMLQNLAMDQVVQEGTPGIKPESTQ